jgi:hypothetical protein
MKKAPLLFFAWLLFLFNLFISFSIVIFIAFIGISLNALCVFTNKDKMPVKIVKGEKIKSENHQKMTSKTKFNFLSDLINVPHTRLVLSVGDIFIYLAILAASFNLISAYIT